MFVMIGKEVAMFSIFKEFVSINRTKRSPISEIMIEQEMEMTQQVVSTSGKWKEHKRWRTPLNEAWKEGVFSQQA